MRRRPDITELSFDKQVQELALWAEANVSPFKDRSASAKAERKARARRDPFFFFQTYLPHYFYDDPAPFHRELVEGMEWRPDPAKHEVVTPFVTAAPRGYAKSTNVSFGYPLQQTVTAQRHFTILGSETGALASSQVAAIKAEFEVNKRLQYDWGQSIMPVQIIEGAVAFVTSEGCAILARGLGQQVRGLKYLQYRPDLVVLDDLESNKSVLNPQMIKKRLKWVTEEIYAGMDVRGSLFIVGTIISLRSALAIMLSAAEPYCNWRRKTYRGLNEKEGGGYYSLWPARFPVQTLLNLKTKMGDAFNKEHQNLPSDEDAAFKAEWIDKHAFELGQVEPGSLPTVGFLDPSISQRATADFRAVASLARASDGTLLMTDALMSKGPLPQVFDHIMTMHNQHKFFNFGCEDNAFQAMVGDELTRLAKKRGVYLPVSGVTHGSNMNKGLRIMRLSPMVQRGTLRFPRAKDRTSDMREMVEQFVYFPNATHDDGPDAAEGAVDLMERGLRAWPGGMMPAGRAAA